MHKRVASRPLRSVAAGAGRGESHRDAVRCSAGQQRIAQHCHTRTDYVFGARAPSIEGTIRRNQSSERDTAPIVQRTRTRVVANRNPRPVGSPPPDHVPTYPHHDEWPWGFPPLALCRSWHATSAEAATRSTWSCDDWGTNHAASTARCAVQLHAPSRPVGPMSQPGSL